MAAMAVSAEMHLPMACPEEMAAMAATAAPWAAVATAASAAMRSAARLPVAMVVQVEQAA